MKDIALTRGDPGNPQWEVVTTNVWKSAEAIVLVDIEEGLNQMDVKIRETPTENRFRKARDGLMQRISAD